MGFLDDHRHSPPGAREAAAVERLIVPPLWRVSVAHGPFQGWFRASAGYLAIQDDGPVLMPFSLPGALAALVWLRGWDIDAGVPFHLPTPKMVDAIWQEATVRADPLPIPPDGEMTTLARFYTHDAAVRSALARTNPDWSNFLSAGMKKDLVITNRRQPGKVAIYGWHQLDGTVIQPVNGTSHADTYVDYSHGVRAIHPLMIVNGEEMPVSHVLRSKDLCGLLSDEGPLHFVR